MRFRGDRGFTLVELMIVMGLALVVLAATLTTFTKLVRNARDTDRRAETAELARNSLDMTARQLRNLAKRVNNSNVILRAESNDFIFQTSDPARTWVRYCLDTTSGGATTTRARLRMGRTAGSTVTATMSTAASCPGTGWDATEVVADYVVNRIGGLTRPVFSYYCLDGTTNCVNPANPTYTLDQIVNTNISLAVDNTPLTGPKEMVVATSVHMRNQNQVPVAAFEAVRQPSPARTMQFNGSASTDYEGRTLQYHWFKTTMPTTAAIDCENQSPTAISPGVKTMWGGRYLGEGVTWRETFPTLDGSPIVIGLVVCDPGDLYGYTTRSVAVS